MEATARIAFDFRCSLELALDYRLRHRPVPPPQGLRTTPAEVAPPRAPYSTMPKPARLPAQKSPSKGEGEPRRRPHLAFGRRHRPAAARRGRARGGGLGRAVARVPPVARGSDAGLFFLCFSHSQSQRRKKKKFHVLEPWTTCLYTSTKYSYVPSRNEDARAASYITGGGVVTCTESQRLFACW
jgi:hypothetical protein